MLFMVSLEGVIDMNVIRSGFDLLYDAVKHPIFLATKEDPQIAHEIFTEFCDFLYRANLEEEVLDHSDNHLDTGFELSNAAGFNKNGEIPPSVLRHLGFDRVNVGTVTGDEWPGNERPNIKRYVRTGSMVNWMGLPGEGAETVAERLRGYGNHNVPLTINFMSTPQKQGDRLLEDLENTIIFTRSVPFVDRYELNVSCPNTHRAGGEGLDARRENLSKLDAMMQVVVENVYSRQEIWVKVSPDSAEADVKDTLDVMQNYRVKGVVIGNTTTQHEEKFISVSPGKGGASGEVVYARSLRVQKMYQKEIVEKGLDLEIIACGGINSPARLEERLDAGAEGIQLFTPLVFSGPKLIRQLKRFRYSRSKSGNISY